MTFQKLHLGIELGSTRVKAVLVNNDLEVVASGVHEWQNNLINGVWTYDLEDVWISIQTTYNNLKENYFNNHNVKLTSISSIGISAMMHGYLALDKYDNLLTPFRTWRNTITESAAYILTNEFLFNIPQRWSIAHLYQSILNNESHVNDISYLTTLAGYVHYKLSGKKVLGIGDASGMFPIDSTIGNYNKTMMNQFNCGIQPYNFKWTLNKILPKILSAGECAGYLSKDGALLLDPSGELQEGIPLCPPEGDAGTGMVATNSIDIHTGNISAGTSVFSMIVLEKELSNVYPEIDVVNTPTGKPVAMVHCNNCTSDINEWIKLFREVNCLFGNEISEDELYSKLFNSAMDAKVSTKGLVHYNYYSGESITEVDDGRPLFIRTPNSELSLGNFMRSLLYSSIATLKIGMDILIESEGIKLNQLLGHGGLFKTKGVGQTILTSALDTLIAVNETAGEGGAWGMAILASYMCNREKYDTLNDYLSNKVFKNNVIEVIEPDKNIQYDFNQYMKEYMSCLDVEKVAIRKLIRE
ncbi:xylulokinase [Breznakia pachnodae]|uniref:Sugar (Pentulose or hexulose) kinase n=1 Tax=Breznakia pachnodae TaxID=265178 RepID=A0ABU0E7R7_9FIRM|nr:FGGY-family carbohydrate kinase [Breznakia pachnodae]MDQ0362753.1 sugar (pentulose or hexulose) kinase [Breznakia pachnodae]